MRFINSKKFSPVIYEKDLPDKDDYFHIPYDQITKDFLNSRDYIIDTAWWEKQYDRCINGYDVPNAIEPGGDCYRDGIEAIWKDNDCYLKDLDITIKNRTVHITGKHYFYLNFWKMRRLIKEIGRKDISNPLFTDLSFENWTIRDRMRLLKCDLQWCKSRQKGFSEEEACDTGVELLFFNNSQSVIVGGQDQYNENTMNMCLRGLERLKNTQFYKEFAKGGERKDYVKTKHTGSEIYSRTAKGNSQAVSGLTPSSVKLEETGIWQRGLVTELSEFLNPSMQAQGVKTGYKTFIGTGGDMEDGVFDMQKMFFSPKEFGLMEFDNIFEDGDTKISRFIPAWKFFIIDEEGNSLREESIADIMYQRSIKSPIERYRYITQFPLTPSELFMVSAGGFFGEAIAQYCNERIAYINNHKEARVEQRFKGKWINPKNPFEGVEMEPDPEGVFVISEHPERDKNKKVYENLYKAGTDSYDQDEAKTSNSKGACIIKKTFLEQSKSQNIYVAYILTRPTAEQGGAELFFEQTAMLCVYYNAINLIEYSKIRIIDWYKNNGFAQLLKLRPELVTASWVDESKVTNRYGIDPATKIHWLTMLRDYLKDQSHIEQFNHPELLNAFAKFKYDPSGARYNCDITIAAALCEVLDADERELMVQESKDEKKILRGTFFKSVNGRMVSSNNLNTYSNAYTN